VQAITIHSFLKSCDWNSVRELAQEKSSVGLLVNIHLKTCAECRARSEKVEAGELAAKGDEHRKKIEEIADRLAKAIATSVSN
jgi:hypothetical protein